MADQEEKAGRLSRRDEVVLNLRRMGMSYRGIGETLSVSHSTAQEWGAAARKHFAELQHIPLETLNLGTRSPGSRISDNERELLNAYFDKVVERMQESPNFADRLLARAGLPPLRPDELEAIEAEVEPQTPDKSNTRRLWAQEIEQERPAPNKRRR